MIFSALTALLFCGGLVGSAWAADAVYSDVAPDQHLKEWLLLGPIPAQEAGAAPDIGDARKMGYEQDLLEGAGGEAKIIPEAGESLSARGGKYAWHLHASASDVIDLINAVGKRDFAVAYAAATIESTEAQPQLVGLGSDDAVRVWLNGELVHEKFASRAGGGRRRRVYRQAAKGDKPPTDQSGQRPRGVGFYLPLPVAKVLGEAIVQSGIAGDAEKVEELVSLGVDANARSPGGITAAQIAKVRGYDPVVDFLISKGAALRRRHSTPDPVSAILAEIASNDAPGVAVLVARDGKVLLSHGFGMADLSHDVPISATTKFRIGSITKQFTAAAILKLQEDGRLSVSDKLSKFFPDFPRGDEVTIRHLLTHTSGIKSFTSKPDFLATRYVVGHQRPDDRFLQARSLRFRSRQQIRLRQFGLLPAGSHHRKS